MDHDPSENRISALRDAAAAVSGMPQGVGMAIADLERQLDMACRCRDNLLVLLNGALPKGVVARLDARGTVTIEPSVERPSEAA